jgi:hypothetical protein
MVDEYIEKLSPVEIKLMHTLTNYDINIDETIQSRDEFDNKSPEGMKMKSLQVWLKKKVGDNASPCLIDPTATNKRTATALIEMRSYKKKKS